MITFSYYQGWFWATFGLTFALAVQSAIYSPAKYGYIKELVGGSNLASPTVSCRPSLSREFCWAPSYSPSCSKPCCLRRHDWYRPDHGLHRAYRLGAGCPATLEWLSPALLPARQQGGTSDLFELAPYLKLRYLQRNLGVLSQNTTIWLSIIGLATFWAISQVMLAAFLAFKDALDITNTVVIQVSWPALVWVLCSAPCWRAGHRNYIETGLIPVGAVGIAIGIAVLPGLGSTFSMGVAFLLVGMMGGLFIVPLNSLIQFQAPASHLGTVLAGNNWIQNVAMLGALILTVLFSLVGIGSVGLFYILTAVAIIGTGYTVRKLPHSLVRILATGILKRRYRVEVIGFDNIPQAGATLLLGNHISWIDWAWCRLPAPAHPLRHAQSASTMTCGT